MRKSLPESRGGPQRAKDREGCDKKGAAKELTLTPRMGPPTTCSRQDATITRDVRGVSPTLSFPNGHVYHFISFSPNTLYGI